MVNSSVGHTPSGGDAISYLTYGRHHIYHHQRCTFKSVGPTSHNYHRSILIKHVVGSYWLLEADPKARCPWALYINLIFPTKPTPQNPPLSLHAWRKVKDSTTCQPGNVMMTTKVWFRSDDYVTAWWDPAPPSRHTSPRQLTLPPFIFFFFYRHWGFFFLLRHGSISPFHVEVNVTSLHLLLPHPPCDRYTLVHRQLSSISELRDRMIIAITLTRLQSSFYHLPIIHSSLFFFFWYP